MAGAQAGRMVREDRVRLTPGIDSSESSAPPATEAKETTDRSAPTDARTDPFGG